MTETTDRHVEEFTTHRPALIGAAYRILGTVTEAEDAVQEAWLRWSTVDLDTVREPRAFLLTTTTRLALNRVREQQRRRETYVGPWLPEPMADPGTDPGAVVELADSVSMAMLVVLSSLSPAERAAFVLKDVFDLPYADVAAALDRSEPGVRQLAHRARSHVQARAPRAPVDPRTHQEVTRRFVAALQGGSIPALLEVLAPDAVLVTDGGGKRQAALRPIHGADKILRFLAGVTSRLDGPSEARLVMLNGEPAVAFSVGGVFDSVGMLRVEDGPTGPVATELYQIRNPDKLVRLATALT